MSTKDRKAKQNKFKENAKKEAAKQAVPKTHLVPVPTWQSSEQLELRGDLLEALEQQLVAAIDAVQKAGQVVQFVMQHNVKSEKIKIDYVWNNGEKPTDEEVSNFKAEMERVRQERQKQAKEFQENLQRQENAAKTGLVGVDGQPIGSTQDLDEESTTEEETEENA